MGELPKYLQIELQEESSLIRQKEREGKYALERRINKSSNYKLFQLMIEGVLTSQEIQKNIYLGDPRKASWSNIREYTSGTLEDQKRYTHIVSTVLEKSDNFLNDSGNAVTLKVINEYYSEAIRKIEDWVPTRRNIKAQMKHLVKFLFCKYDVPNFLYKGFERNDINYIYLFLYIGSGKSFKDFDNLPPMVLNKKIYQHLFTADEGDSYNEAFRRAQILTMGGEESLVSAIAGTSLNDRITNDQFWVTVFQLFINTPMLNMDKVPEMIDYIKSQKFGFQAPHPTFNMKGRTINSLLRQSDEWHEEQARNNRRMNPRVDRALPNIGNYTYEPAKFVYTEWEGYKNIRNYDTGGGQTAYRITQILNNNHLKDEGNYMRNCVLSYQSSCQSKKCTIFSFRKHDKIGQIDMAATIEVRKDEREYKITQIREKYNKRPTESTMNHIRKWALRENLIITKHAT